jgi:peptidoglycan/xylan/chitin deacetylase (PgdA/CDA1 family)
MMTSQALRRRLWNRWRRFTIDRYARRDFRLSSDVPYVSFTFDDFPRSAFAEGGRILAEQGVRGTYFVSLQLLGAPSVSGVIASREDLRPLLRDGHELGCHTFEHLDGSRSTAAAFERSIEANRAALAEIVPGSDFSVFAYPLNGPVLSIKRAVGRHFVGCRGGGQAFNAGVMDLNLLNAYFLDKRNRGNLDAVRHVIEQNAAARGWLIFATHDVAANPSRYGCEPGYFEEVVRLSLQSGARVLPMIQVCQELSIAR